MARSWRRRVVRGLVLGLHDCGVLRLVSRLRRRAGSVILMYHSVADQRDAEWIDPCNHLTPEHFEAQMQFLATQRHVISLSELVSALRSGDSGPTGSVVITFDDGYLDNLTVAAPILARYQLPATLFLPSGQIDRGETQWIDEIYTCFRYRTVHVLSRIDGLNEQYDLSQPDQSATAYRAVCQRLMTSEYHDRRQLLDAVRNQLQPSRQVPRLTMTWDDVQTLRREFSLFELGGHTVDHTDLSQRTQQQALQELQTCRQQIQQMTGTAPAHFSFPYGRTSPQLRQVVEQAEFQSACGGGRDPVNQAGVDCYALRRVAAPASPRQIDFLTSSMNSGLLHRITR